ncbi:HAMP domain-containing sensor histidine kinase [Streptomyces sp. B3I8]|uniref:sensor histidine kinase n=1 Tax=Streptomyces sp. B3I8 TaxID=3042303 RepID=UPI00277D21EF|nr:ATP-binding protein [Streptomyces sp. B3I8]MDQ0788277.1 signal transduction histidine kinase [Streptomyces sp. B3I8]
MRLNPRAALPHARAALLSPRATLRRLPFRTRLAAAICTLFLAAGIALLTFVVLLARHGTDQQVQGMAIARSDHGPTDPRSPFTSVPVPPDAARPNPTTPRPNPTTPRSNPVTPRPVGVATRPVGVVPRPYDVAEVWKIDQSVRAVQETALRQMVLWSAVGLLVMAVLAGLLGWWLAGRALRPVVSMTEAARRISEQNLHQRLALDGPPDELHLLADTFDTMLDRLEKSFESRRRFVANASHELKTPLAVQRTSLQVGLADPLPDGLAEVREDLLDANREAEQLIDALLLLARSDRGLTRTARVDLAATARRVTTRLAAQATRRGLRLDLDVTPEGAADTPPLVHGDPVLLSHLLTNLVHNAVQYNHPGGHVRVRLGTRTVTVTNTGPDIPPERIPDLFEPFQRLGPSRTATTGHGLGLSIAHSIAEAHHATLTARPGPEGGLVVTVRFP